MGMLNSNSGMGQTDWLTNMLGRMGPQQQGPGWTGPTQSSVAPGASASTGNPATYWWNQPGAGTGAVMQAPRMNNSALTRLMGF